MQEQKDKIAWDELCRSEQEWLNSARELLCLKGDPPREALDEIVQNLVFAEKKFIKVISNLPGYPFLYNNFIDLIQQNENRFLTFIKNAFEYDPNIESFEDRIKNYYSKPNNTATRYYSWGKVDEKWLCVEEMTRASLNRLREKLCE